MPSDLYSKWGVDPNTLPVPVDAAPSVGLDIAQFGDKWGLNAPSETVQPERSGWDKLLGRGGERVQTLPERIARSIGSSVASGATLPGDVASGKVAVDPNDPSFIGRTLDYATMTGTGAIPSVTRASAPLIDPATASLASLARDTYGIPLRGGQISEKRGINYLDSVLQDKPFSGYAGNVAEQHTSFNRAVASAIGEKADKITPEVMSAAKTRLGQNYEDIAAQTTLKLDDKLGQHFTKIAEDAEKVLAPSERSIIHNQIGNILDKAKGVGEIDGKTFQALIKTGSPLDRATKSADTNVKYYAGEIKSALVQAMERHAPEDMQSLLKKTNSQYKAMKTIEDLAEKSPTGDVSPALLMGAVRKSYGNMAYGGGGELADLARIGQRFLKEPPNSGTADRLSAMKILGLGGASGAEAMLAYHDPVMAAKIAGLAAAAGVGKGVFNAAAGSALRSDWYANKLINSSLPGRSAPRSNMLQELTNGNVNYLPPGGAIPQLTFQPRQNNYAPAQ